MESFGQRLRALRIDCGMSVRGLAEAAGVDAGFISRVERGVERYRRPKAVTVQKLASAMRLAPEEEARLLELVGRTPSAPHPPAGVSEPRAARRASGGANRMAALEQRVADLERAVQKLGGRLDPPGDCR